MNQDAANEMTPPNREVWARQAYGFFYLRPEDESSALAAAKRPLRSSRGAYEEYLGVEIVEKMLEASALETFLQYLQYRIERDGEGRIISILRRDETAVNPALDHQVLKEMATYALGAELVFANEFGDGWEWKADGNALRHRSGHVTVTSKS